MDPFFDINGNGYGPDCGGGEFFAGAGYGSGLSYGYGYGLPLPVNKPINPKAVNDYVTGGFGMLAPKIPQALTSVVDDLTAQFGPQVYDAMDTDPFVGATFRLFKMAVLAAGVSVVPAVVPSPDKAHPDMEMERSPDELLAAEIAQFIERCLQGCKTPPKVLLSEMLDACKHGNKLAEKTGRLADEGTPDAGRIVLHDIKVKPRWAWLFVVDVFWEVQGVFCYDPTHGGYIVVPRDKFFILSWQMRENDPRGTSLYRQAYRAWNVKQQIYPEYFKQLVQFGSPSITGTTAEGEEANQGYMQVVQQPYPDPPFGPNGAMAIPAPESTIPFTAQQRMVQALDQWRNGTVAAFPFGATVTVHWPQGSGEHFTKAFDLLNREIVYGIVGTTRDSMEAEHGSKADSNTAQDKSGNLIREARDWLATGLKRDVFHWLVDLNYGKDVADRLTPNVDLGEVEHHDVVALMNGVANLIKAGGIDMPSQGDGITAMLDLPAAAPGAFREMADRNHEAAMKVAKVPGDGEPDGDGKPGKKKVSPSP